MRSIVLFGVTVILGALLLMAYATFWLAAKTGLYIAPTGTH
jgi:hypothetical protein